MSKIIELESKIKTFNKEIVDEIFSSADNGEITKLEAIRLLSENDLLGISRYYANPTFMDSYFESGNVERYRTQMYYPLIEHDHNFKKENGEIPEWSYFPEITHEQAINETYDFIKEEGIIGCIHDW